jgi:hypothetical protein
VNTPALATCAKALAFRNGTQFHFFKLKKKSLGTISAYFAVLAYAEAERAETLFCLDLFAYFFHQGKK